MTQTRSRHGFTLIEVIVCMTITGALVALLLCAVLRSRSASRRLSCLNNLHQLGVSISSFETTMQRYPGVFCGFVEGSKPGQPGYVSFSPSHQMAMYLEQGVIEPITRYGLNARATDPNWLETNLASPAILRCPDDSRATGMASSYRFNRGILPLWPKDPGGVFVRLDQGFRPQSITDGLSCTAFASERPVTSTSAVVSNAMTDLILVDSQPGRLTELCWEANLSAGDEAQAGFPNVAGSSWLSGRWLHASYYHFLPPNSSWFDCATGSDPVQSLINARSYHDGGVNVLYGDGSVRFRTAKVALPVWRSEGTRAGGEIDPNSD